MDRGLVHGSMLIDGTIVEVGPDLDPRQAERTWDLIGRVVAPGLVDNHMHTTLGPGGRAAFAMLARAGVTTAVDFAGPPAAVLDLMARYDNFLATEAGVDAVKERHLPYRALDLGKCLLYRPR